MNKSLLVNMICVVVVVLGHTVTPASIQHHVLNTGYFAFSGAITNWLAVYMLFEKVPGLYGSGIIPLRFEAFKSAIKTMVMTQFFSLENIKQFASKEAIQEFNFDPVIEKINYDHMFEGLVEAINQSKIGSMLSMFGGSKVIEPMREPFAQTMRTKLKELAHQPEFKEVIESQHPLHLDEHLQEKISEMVQHRLNQLTPDAVKRIVEQMIRSHLGWLVVWGGVFGGLIGLVSSFVIK
ncbi:MAG: DUF445 family protein [Acidobacteria bacterium]|nr:DUF445 family protein [Acidobacteriota bacterium]